MSVFTLKFCVGMAVWSGLLIGSLSVARLPGDWGHGICGPWGCGPPTQALVACHLAWLIVCIPPAIFMLRWSRRARLWGGLLLTVLSSAALLSIGIHQWFHWLPAASEWQRPFFWQRCAFCIVTTVDIPIIQSLAVGLLALLMTVSSRRRKAPTSCAMSGALTTGNSS